MLQYLRTPPAIALDASPAINLRAVMRQVGRLWLKRFDSAAGPLASYFATEASKRVDSVLQGALRDAGFTVRFKLTDVQRDVIQASIAENVALIRSIPEQYLKSVEGAVMRSISTGRDLGTLRNELVQTYGVTKRRANLISLQQNNAATAALNRSRQLQIGARRAIWRHSAAGVEEYRRPTHVAFSGHQYDIADGVILNPKEGICWPGTLIGCKCTSSTIIPGLEAFVT